MRANSGIKVFFLYCLFAALFYSPVVLSGKSLNPTLFQPHGVLPGGVYEKEGRSPVNSFNVDIATPVYYEFPVNKLVGEIYRKGELPLWNPYQAGGIPLAAQYSTRAFFPYQILEDLSPPGAWDVFLLGRLVIAGFFTFLFLRRVGLRELTAFAGGLFYIFSGVFTWFLNLEQFSNTAMMVPVVMYAVDALAQAPPGAKRALRLTALNGVVFSLLHLAGQPEVALYASLLAAVWFFLRALSLHGRAGLARFFLRFSSSYAIGLALAAPLLLVFVELMNSSFHIHPGGGRMGIEALHNWKTIFAVLTPSATEFSTNHDMISGLSLLVDMDGSFFRFLPINGVWDNLGGFTGVLTVYVAVTGVLISAARKDFGLRAPVFLFFSFAAFVVLKNLGVRPFLWIGYLPLFDRVWTLRWAGPVWIFSLSVAAALGLEAIAWACEGVKTEEAKTRGGRGGRGALSLQACALYPFLLLGGAYTVFSFMPVISLTLARAESFNSIMRPFVVPSLFYGSLLTLAVLVFAFLIILFGGRGGGGRRGRAESGLLYALIMLGLVELWWSMPRGWGPEWLSGKWAPAGVGFAAALFFFYERPRVGLSLAALFFVLFHFMDTLSPSGYPERQDPFKAPPYVEFLKSGENRFYRAAGFYGALFPNYSSALGVHDVRYVNALTPLAYHNFRKTHLHAYELKDGEESALWFTGRPERSVAVDKDGVEMHYLFLKPVEEDILNKLRSYTLLAVRYFVFPAGHPGFNPVFGLRLVYDEEVKIYENPQAPERVFVAHAFDYADSFEEAQAMAMALDSGVTERIVLEEEPTGVETMAEPGSRNSVVSPGYTAVIREYKTNSVVVEVTAESDGVLVLADTYYPGWTATVNGEKSRVLRVNGLVRGVVVKKGESTVEFRYCPLSFKAGMALFFVTGILCIFLIHRGKGEQG